jgi:bleomycin hydrolase
LLTNALYKVPLTTLATNGTEVAQQNFVFSIDIKTLPSTNQKQSGRCWLFAACNVLREIIAKEKELSDFELSQSWLAFWDKFERANFFLESILATSKIPLEDRLPTFLLKTGVGDGGQWDMFAGLIKKYGVVPKSAFPETFASGSTRSWASLVNRRLRKFAADVQKNKDDAEKIGALKDTCLKELYDFSTSCFGQVPETFDFEYTDKDKNYHVDRGLTPKTFYEKYVGLDLDDYASLITSPTKDKPYHERFTVNFVGNIVDQPVVYLNLTMQELKDAIVAQLKDGQIVWFGSDCGRWGDRKTGVWDMNGYDLGSLFDLDISMTKEDSLYYCESAMNHAMCITGVSFDENGNPDKWKIENSWGDEMGNKGYYLASAAWFDTYVFQAVVHTKYLPDEIVACLSKKPHDLNPWDPMGTLAD